MANKILLSEDGSHTLVSDKFGTSYHSTYGALTESRVVFIKYGLDHYNFTYPIHEGLSIFEMGFGTGLNALLTAIWAAEHQISICYHSIEAYPISSAEYAQLNYGELLDKTSLFADIHNAAWDTETTINEYFTIKKIHAQLEDVDLAPEYDIIFYDAFGPGTQESLWEQNITDKLYACLNLNGILTTYCAKGSFKRNLKASGFTVEGLPGPPGKREITRAIKTN